MVEQQCQELIEEIGFGEPECVETECDLLDPDQDSQVTLEMNQGDERPHQGRGDEAPTKAEEKTEETSAPTKAEETSAPTKADQIDEAFFATAEETSAPTKADQIDEAFFKIGGGTGSTSSSSNAGGGNIGNNAEHKWIKKDPVVWT